MTPTITGTVAATTSMQSVSLKDLSGNSTNTSVTTSNYILAYYLGNDSNRKYPPDVVKGEQVRITRFGGVDKYHWESLGRDDALRKTETHRIEAKDRSDSADPSDDDHTYSVEIDTKRNKHISMKTSQGTGEDFSYVVKLDAANGNIQIADNAGNSLTIESAAAKVILRNSKNAFVMLNGEDALLCAPRDVTIKAGRQILVTGQMISVVADGGSGG